MIKKKEQFKVNIAEGHLIARTALSASLDSTDMAAWSIAASVIIRHASWPHHSRFPRDVQATVEDFPFEDAKLFMTKTDESLHSLKDTRATLKSLGIYTPANKKKEGRYYNQRVRSPPCTQHRKYDQHCKQQQIKC